MYVFSTEQFAMADSGGFLNKSIGFSGRMRNEDFDEEDVWGTVANEKKKDYASPKTRRVSKDNYSSGSSSSATWHQPTSPRKIPRANNSITLPFSEGKVGQGSSSSSAPMDIPDWSKIYGKKGSCVDVGEGDSSCYGDHYTQNDYGDDDDDENDEDGIIPPHEWITRRLARSQISSFSVCEGVGRTLKGRDLSKVRNAILTKTGFIE